MSNNIPTTIIKDCDYTMSIYGSRPHVIGKHIIIIPITFLYESPIWRLKMLRLSSYLETVLITSAATIYISNEQ